MKFLITTPKELQKKMLSDLDSEIKVIADQKKSLKYRMASKLSGKALKTPLLFEMNYKVISNTQYELTIVTTAETFVKKGVIENQIINRTKGYGEGIKVEVVK